MQIQEPIRKGDKLHLLGRSEIMHSTSTGPMSLPPTFKTAESAAKWAKEGNEVIFYQQPQILQGTQYTAPGWEVWKDDKGQPYKVTLPSGTYVLMFRSRDIQDAVHQAYANLSRERMIAEATGETLEKDGPGMLSHKQLNKDTPDPEVDAIARFAKSPGISGNHIQKQTHQLKR